MSITYKKEDILLKRLLFLSLVLSMTLLLFLPIFVYAKETFIPLTNGGIPGIQSGTSFNDFLNATFKLGLAVAATLAVVMITIGGLQYMTTDSIFDKSEGKEKIQNAVVGLLIALLIWLILFTINPNLLKFDINISGDRQNQSTSKSTQTEQGNNKKGKTLKRNIYDSNCGLAPDCIQ